MLVLQQKLQFAEDCAVDRSLYGLLKTFEGPRLRAQGSPSTVNSKLDDDAAGPNLEDGLVRPEPLKSFSETIVIGRGAPRLFSGWDKDRRALEDQVSALQSRLAAHERQAFAKNSKIKDLEAAVGEKVGKIGTMDRLHEQRETECQTLAREVKKLRARSQSMRLQICDAAAHGEGELPTHTLDDSATGGDVDTRSDHVDKE